MIKFPWTKTKERIEELQKQIWILEGELNGHREDSVSRVEFIKLSKTVSENHEHVLDFNSNHSDLFNACLNKIEIIEQRLGKAELMHAATSKKQNELFESAMSKMIDAYSRFSIHISNLSEQKIAEISDFVGIPDLRKERVLIAINGQPETFDSNEISYNDILERFFFHFPNKKDSAPYSIVYEDGGDESKPFGTMVETDVLLIKTGTVVNVSIISAEGG